MTTRKYTSRSQQTTLTGSVTSGASTVTVSSATTLLGGVTISAGQTFTVVIDPDTALEEIVDVTSYKDVNSDVRAIVKSLLNYRLNSHPIDFYAEVGPRRES